MTLHHVISLGHISYWHILFTTWWTYVGLVLSIISLWIFGIVSDDFRLGPSFISMFAFFIFATSTFAVPGSIKQSRVDTWTHHAAYPYINSLPVQHHDIVYIKVQDTSETTGAGGLFTFSISSHDITHVLVLYRDNGQIKKMDMQAKMSMKLGQNDTPYITFQQLRHNLGNGINAGLYNPTVYLPKNYKFSTIQ